MNLIYAGQIFVSNFDNYEFSFEKDYEMKSSPRSVFLVDALVGTPFVN